MVKVLLVEDNYGDARLLMDLLEEIGGPASMTLVTNGDDAIALLKGQGRYAGAARPDIVLLDINLPRKNGFEVVQAIKSDRSIQHIPVIVITSSDSPSDMERMYRLCVNSYLLKPPDLKGWELLVRAISSYWLELARLPPAV